jgi:ribosomal-protein-alanine N-acetyltransferase
MRITIESASTKDADRLYEIETECFGKEAFTKKQIAQLLLDYNSVSLLARCDGRVVGFIMGRLHVEEEVLAGHILTLDVLPAVRGRGIGRRLLREIENIFVQKNISESYLEAREDNVGALRLYERMGYKKIGKLKNYYGDAHGVYLKKVLRQSE